MHRVPTGHGRADSQRVSHAERLEQHAETLAAAQRVTATRRADRRLAKRLADNGRVLLEAYRGVEQAVAG